MSYARQYTDALQAYLTFKEQKAQRRQALEDQVRGEEWIDKWGRRITNLDAGMDLVINSVLANDPTYKDLQVQMDRAAAEATMFGIGAIIRNLAYLSKGSNRA
jgi:hypothetical protein